MNEKYFKENEFVKVSKDNENYDDLKNKKLQIVEIITSSKEHKAYDDSMNGMPLYSLKDVETGQLINYSLYFYELEKWD